MNIKQMTKALRKAREAEGFCTLLGIGPMSPALIQATLELSQEQDFPILYIASRNQVDMDEFGAGYVNGWDQKRMVTDIKAIADKIGYTGQYYICRDHGGPWQRDEERKAALPTEEAMAIGLKSYLEDVDAGFDLLHIDPTKDPHISGTVPMELVLDRTVTLIEAVEKYIKENNLAPVGYEVGTEETNGGLTGTEEYTAFIEKLFEDPAVTKELNAMLDRLEKANVPARRYVLDKIKSRIGEYVTCYNLRGLTSKLRKYAE